LRFWCVLLVPRDRKEKWKSIISEKGEKALIGFIPGAREKWVACRGTRKRGKQSVNLKRTGETSSGWDDG